MALENEARFHLPEAKYPHIVERLNAKDALAPFELSSKGMKTHSDTYFDINGQLRNRGSSLRIRMSEKGVRATLKTPTADGDSTFGSTMEELENSDNAEFFSAIAQIIEKLTGAGVIGGAPLDAEPILMVKGAYPTLRDLGLKDLFTVRTSRHRWVISENSADLAELAVDDSFYDVGIAGPESGIRECRVEVELFDASQSEALNRICEKLTSRFGISEVHDSKFERGMLHSDTRGLRDKLEVKLKLGKESDFETILGRIEHDPMFVPHHRFTRMPERAISDVYFDSPGQDLLQAGHYLRLRREGQGRELVFRRLTQAVKYGHVLQEEVVAKGDGEPFLRNWHLIQRWLSGTTGKSITGDIDGVNAAPNFLNGAGLRPVLEVEIDRLPWIVERIDEPKSTAAAPDHVAKVKYDQITTRRADNREAVLHSVEFEVTGVESDSGTPQANNRLGYEAFVPAFE
jgi:adenylate cyclase class IV